MYCYVKQGFSNCGSWPACGSQSRTRWFAQSHLAAFAFQWHTQFRSRPTQYTNINYELRYCLVRFLNHKRSRFKIRVAFFESRRALVEITEMVSEWQFIKGSSALLMRRKLAHFTALCSARDCINRKIIILQKLFQVCSFSSISSVWTGHCLYLRDILYIFSVDLKSITSVHYPVNLTSLLLYLLYYNSLHLIEW